MERSLVPENAGEQEEEPLAKQLHQEAQGLKVQQVQRPILEEMDRRTCLPGRMDRGRKAQDLLTIALARGPNVYNVF